MQEMQQRAAQQRTLLEWIAVAVAAHSLVKAVEQARNQRSLQERGETKSLATKSKAHWLRAKRIVNSSVTEKGNLQEIFKSRAERSKAAWERWDDLLRVTKFLARLKYRSKLTRSAVAIKQFIEGAWRGMRFRARVGAYLYNVRALPDPQLGRRAQGSQVELKLR